MPRTRALTDSGKMVQQKVIARNACKALLDEKRISYTQVARILDKTPQAIAKQFSTDSITLETAFAVIYLAKADAQQIERIMKAR